MTTVTGCMLLGNGYERTVSIVLNSFKPFCHKIIVYDGSNDGCYDLIKDRVDTRIAETPPLDFARFRNICLEAVNTPWALFVDADEFLYSAISPEKFWDKLEEKKVNAFRIKRFAFPFGANYPEPQVRIVRKGSGRYERNLHEGFIPYTDEVLNSFLLIHLARSREALIKRDAKYWALNKSVQRGHSIRPSIKKRTAEEYEFAM